MRVRLSRLLSSLSPPRTADAFRAFSLAVVFAMVIIEGVGGDMGLQRVFVIGQGRKFESHGASSRQVDHVIGRGIYPTRLNQIDSTKLI